MRYLIKLHFLILALAFFAACDKKDNLPYYKTGVPPVLSSSTNIIAPVPADSLSNVVTLSWSNPDYATDSSTAKYIIQFDSVGRKFAKAASLTVTGKLDTTLTAKQINNILLGFGFSFGVAYDVDVRVVSSYANNNDQKTSNTVTIKMTPYRVPPKVVPPDSKTLFLVGSATAGGWDNPVPVPAQQFQQLDSVTYQGTFYLNGGGEYLLLPVNGDWTHKYSVADKTVSGLNAGGDFGADLNDNIPGPDKTGVYTITVDFQRGKFTVTQVKLYDLLYVPGDYQGWAPATAPTLGSPNADGSYDGYVNIPSGGTYEFKLTNEPDWNGTAYGDGGGGTLSTSGGNLKVADGGYYHLQANTTANTWSATKTTWSLIGDFNGWSADADMTYDAGKKAWVGTIAPGASGGFKFRANHAWDLNYGDDVNDGSLEPGGANLPITAGTHTITLYLGGSGYYTYTIN